MITLRSRLTATACQPAHRFDYRLLGPTNARRPLQLRRDGSPRPRPAPPTGRLHRPESPTTDGSANTYPALDLVSRDIRSSVTDHRLGVLPRSAGVDEGANRAAKRINGRFAHVDFTAYLLTAGADALRPDASGKSVTAGWSDPLRERMPGRPGGPGIRDRVFSIFEGRTMTAIGRQRTAGPSHFCGTANLNRRQPVPEPLSGLVISCQNLFLPTVTIMWLSLIVRTCH
jgi:hypothetical protein